MAKKASKRAPAKTPEDLAAEADAEAMGPVNGHMSGPEADASASVSPEPEAAPSKRKGTQVAEGPTTGYRDASKDADAVVCIADFPDGFLPTGWHDTPAKCKNYSGKGHDDYIRVALQPSGKWAPLHWE